MRHELTIHLTRASFAEVYKPFTSTKETREIVGRLHTCCQWKMSWKLSLMLKLKLVGKYDVFKSPILSTIIVVVIVTGPPFNFMKIVKEYPSFQPNPRERENNDMCSIFHSK